MRSPMHVRPSAAWRAVLATARRLALLCGLLVASTVAMGGSALADSLSLSITPEPVEEVTSQITVSASSEDGTLAVIAVNNPGVPCAANPEADTGKTVTPGHLLEGANVGLWSRSVNYTPPSTGAYTVCGWLEIPAGWLEVDGGPVTAAASLPIEVRPPRISLSLSFPRRPVAGRRFTVSLLTTTEVQREVVVEGIPYTRRGCPVNYAAGEAEHLIDQSITGGPWRSSVNVEPLRAGSRTLFCAWADPEDDDGLYPEARTSLMLNLAAHPMAGRATHRPRQGRAR